MPTRASGRRSDLAKEQIEKGEGSSDKCKGMAVPECLENSSQVIERVINGLNFSAERGEPRRNEERKRENKGKAKRMFLIGNCLLSSTRSSSDPDLL